MAREYFNAYHSYIEAMEELSDAECGRLFRACLNYSMSGIVTELRGNERIIFPGMKWQIDRDAKNYANKCTVNQRNGALGGRANATERKRTLPNGGETRKEKEKEKEKNVPPIPPKGFDVFWGAYPKKVGKDAARKAYNARKPSQEMLSAMLAAIETQCASPQWQKDGGQFIPNPATWLKEGRWMDEPLPVASRRGYKQHAYTERDLDKLLINLDDEPKE